MNQEIPVSDVRKKGQPKGGETDGHTLNVKKILFEASLAYGEKCILTPAYPRLQSSARKISISLSIHFALMMRSALGEHFGSTGHSFPGIQRDKTMDDKLVYIIHLQ